jgi:transcriptional regulator with XRE-family HTH domain
MAGQRIDPIDKHVGSRIRMRRLMLQMSQGTLANQLGLTFQQVQKYEKGKNRVSASRLQHLSGILQVAIPFFFEELPREVHTGAISESSDYVSDFLATTDGLALAAAFVRVERPALRRCIVQLVEEIAEKR